MATAPLPAQIELPNEAYLLPDSVAMWPPVWWTWLILGVFIITLCLVIYLSYKHYKKRAYRREALATLNKSIDDLTDKECILLCHELIRRCLLSENKPQEAALPSDALIQHADKNMPKKLTFTSLSEDFIHGPYRPQVELSTELRQSMIKTTRYWIRKHHA